MTSIQTRPTLITHDNIRELTHEIWSGMLQIELNPTDAIREESDGIGACVQITGSWEGAVRVDCSMNLARIATSRFMGMKPAEVDIDQVRDAMGELANMSAGSVKPLLPPPCQLSLPSVADGGDCTLTISRGRVLLQAGFEFEGELLSITVLQRMPRIQ